MIPGCPLCQGLWGSHSFVAYVSYISHLTARHDHKKAAGQSMRKGDPQWPPSGRIQVGQLGDRTAVLPLLDKQGCRDH